MAMLVARTPARGCVWLTAMVVAMTILVGFAPRAAAATSAGATTVGTVQTATVTLRQGMKGPAVVALQKRLVELRYWLGGVDGIYGPLTAQAVMAFQKVNGLTRDGIAGPQTMRALQNPIKPKPRSTTRVVVEVPRSRQVVLLVRSGRVDWIFNASTGTARTPTPSGTFTVYRHIDGWRQSSLGMLYRPKYVLRGYALHGSTSVPAQPASHGCVRVNLRAMDYLWPRMPIGTSVRVY